MQKIEKLTNISSDILSYFKNDPFLNKDVETIDYLEVTKSNLENRKYVVSIIAAMKAGKSTTFNALLGRDLLPNENASCTTAITEIKYSKKECESIDKVYKGGKIVKITAGNGKTVEEKFHEDVRASRSDDKVKDIEKYYLECPIYAIENMEYKDLVQNFVLVDTPGPNEASIGEFDVAELQKVALNQLRNSDALIMLLDYQGYKSDTNADILKNIFEGRTDLAKDQEKIYFLVNKIDAMTAKDGTVEEVIENVKKLVREHAPFITNPNVYTFSARQGVLARMIMNGKATKESIKETKQIYGGKYTIINDEGDEIIPNPSKWAGKLFEESNIEVIEKEIISNMFKKSSNNMFKSGIDKLEKTIANITDKTTNLIETSKMDADKIYKEVTENKNKIEELRNEGEILKEIPKDHLKMLKQQVNSIINEIPSNVSGIVQQIIPSGETIESEDQSYLQDRINSIQRDAINSIQLSLNRDIDRIQRLSIDCQNKIGQDLNKEFYNLSDKASAIVGQKMAMSLNILTMNDITPEEIEKTSANIDQSSNTTNYGNENNKIDGNDVAGGAAAGATVGGTIGTAIPVVGTVIGAAVGAVIGGLASLFSNGNQAQPVQNKIMYSANIGPIKDKLMNNSIQISKKIVADIEHSVNMLECQYNESVESQINDFINNLKKQLDEIVEEYEKNKDNIESYIKQMEHIGINMSLFRERINSI